MCGIAALFGSAVNAQTLATMLDVAARRGPEGTGTAAHPHGMLGHAALGFVARGHNPQPLCLPDGSRLAWNGEIYNWRALRDAHGFAAANDTQLLLCGLREHGCDFLRELDGQFAFVAYIASGAHAGQSWLGRDAWGICPLVYGYNAQGWLALGSTPEVVERAGVRDVKSVPAGTFGRIVQTSLTLEGWLDAPRRSGAAPLTPQQIREHTLSRIHSRIPQEPRELFTTMGGMDSQFVSASVARALRGRFGGAITVVPPDAALRGSSAAPSDLPYVRATLEQLASEGITLEHHVVPLTPAFVAHNLDRLLLLLGPDLFHILCGLAEDLVAETAKRLGGRAIMTAGGPDEAGRSYERWTFLHRGLDEELAWRRLCEQFGSSEGVRAGLVFGERGIENRVPLADLIELATDLPTADKQRVLDEGDGRRLASLRLEGKLFWRRALRGLLPDVCLDAPKAPIHGSTGALHALLSVARADARFDSVRSAFALRAFELGWNGIVFGDLRTLQRSNALTEGQLYALYRWSLLRPVLFELGGEHRYGRYIGYLPRFEDDLVERRHKPLCYDWQLGKDVPLRPIE